MTNKFGGWLQVYTIFFIISVTRIQLCTSYITNEPETRRVPY